MFTMLGKILGGIEVGFESYLAIEYRNNLFYVQ